MADYAIHDTTLTGISDVIRKKEGSSALIDPADYADRINLMGMLEEKTISGAIASCSDGADSVPVKSWEIEIEPNLDGVSQIVATQGKKNFIPLLTWYNAGYEYTNAGITFKVLSDGGIRITGKTTSANYSQFNIVSYTSAPTTQWQLYVPKGNYAFSLTGITSYIRLVTSGSSNNGFPYSEVTYSAQSRTGAVTDDTKPFNYVILRVYPTEDDIDVTVYPQLEVGSSATSFEPYSAPVDKTVNLGRTIHGGTADVVNGTGTETYIGKDMNSLEWVRVQYQTSGIYGFRHIPIDKKNGAFNVMANGYTTATSGHGWGVNMEDMTVVGQSGTSNIFIRDDRYTTAEAFTEAVSGKIAYELADEYKTEITFTPITPTPETALGVNNFWADTGDSEVVYRGSGTITPIVPTLISKSITENDTYNASDDNADGYSQVTVNVPQGSTIPFEKVWSSGDTGSEVFTCTEAGTYLFMVGTSARGTATITSSVTADFTSSKQGSDGRGLVIAVYTLAVGDTVTMTNTIVDWVYRVKAVFKTSLSVSATIDSTIVTDGTLSSFSPTFTGDALFVYMAGGRADTNSYDRTYATDNFEWASKVETQTFIRLSYGSDTPTPSLYGYDGGCALAICLQ